MFFVFFFALWLCREEQRVGGQIQAEVPGIGAGALPQRKRRPVRCHAEGPEDTFERKSVKECISSIESNSQTVVAGFFCNLKNIISLSINLKKKAQIHFIFHCCPIGLVSSPDRQQQEDDGQVQPAVLLRPGDQREGHQAVGAGGFLRQRQGETTIFHRLVRPLLAVFWCCPHVAVKGYCIQR